MVIELNLEDIYPVKTYFYIDDKTNSGFLIDPGAEPDKILEYIKKYNFKIEKILLTHGHFDHTGAVRRLQKELNIKTFIHEDEEIFMKDCVFNLSKNFNKEIIIDEYEKLKDGDKISLNDNPKFSLMAIHAPGHTPGSVIFYNPEERIAFIGDVMFEQKPGLTHFPGGNDEILKRTILEKIATLPQETILYSGHASPISVKDQMNLITANNLL